MSFQNCFAGVSQSPVFVMLWICLLSSSAMGQQIELNLSSQASVYAPGESFIVDLSLENPAGDTVRGLQHAIEWDSGSLQLLSVDLPGSLNGSPDPEILVWNAPEPAGSGGDQGCASWWDGSGQEAFSLGLILTMVAGLWMLYIILPHQFETHYALVAHAIERVPDVVAEMDVAR